MMESCFVLCLFIWLVCVPSCSFKSILEEPMTCRTSRFDFEDRLLERSIVLAHDMKILKEKVDTKLDELQIEKENMLKDLSTLSEQLATEQRSKNEQLTTLAETVSNGFKDKLTVVDKELTKKTVAIDNQMTLQQEQMKRMSSDFQKFTNETLVKLKGKQVAFSVTSPTGQIVNGAATFSTIMTNIGDGYNKETGQFTCPVAGVYQFSFTVYSTSSSADVHCWIRVNGSGKVLGRVYKSQHSSHTVTVTWLLQLGDVVDLGSCYGWSNVFTHTGYTVFNGVLISET